MPEIIVNEVSYTRVVTATSDLFNPTLNEDGTPIYFEILTRVNQGLLTPAVLSQLWFKFHVYNSGGYINGI